jgi:hypothetical protein
MAGVTPAIAQSLDHFVVPSIYRRRRILRASFGGILGKRNGLNVRQRKRGACRMRLFKSVANAWASPAKRRAAEAERPARIADLFLHHHH